MNTQAPKPHQVDLADGVKVEIVASVEGVSQVYSTADGVLVSESLKSPDEAEAVANALKQAAAEVLVLRSQQ